MKYVILVSHGTFAPGLHNTLGMLAGSARKDILDTSLLDGMSISTFEKNFIELIKDIAISDKIILLGDIIGGSPMTTALMVLANMGLLKNTIAFGGMNLSMALTAVLEDDADSESFKKAVISEAHESVAEFHLEIQDEEEI